MQNMKTTWVIVASSNLAKFFRMKKFPKLEVITTLHHPESKLHNADLVSSKPGSSVGTIRHAYSPVTEPKRHELEKFSKEIASKLIAAFQKGEFHRYYLIAGPQFLGLLRQELDDKIKEGLIAAVDKDMTAFTTEEIETHLNNL